jgi:monoamine oxidase
VGYFKTYNTGKNILDLEGKLKTYRGTIPKLDLFSLLNLDWLIRKLEKLARQINPKAPWNHPKAKEFDGQTLDQFLRKSSKTKACYQVIRVGCETIFACDPHEISFLHALFYIRSGTSLECLINVEGGAQQHRIKGGMQTLVEAMAQPFLEKILLQSAVNEISYSANEVSILGEDFSVSASKAILAVPPPLLAEIHFSPGLPPAKTTLIQNYPMGRVAKCFMIYEKPFWRDLGYSGQSVSDENTPFQTLYDCSPADASKGILMGFVVGSRADRFFALEKGTRQQEMRSVLSRYFGEKAKESIAYEEFTMTDEPWSRGCYAGLMRNNAWTESKDAYRQSLPPLYFAGTEAAVRWHGYIEGAVLSGESAASEVIKSLQDA